MAQQPSEDFDQFVTMLKTVAQNCEFGQLKDALIGDRIVIGVTNHRVRERLLRHEGGDSELTLNEVITFGKYAEVTMQHLPSWILAVHLQ